jgi:HlyD family secretion protein
MRRAGIVVIVVAAGAAGAAGLYVARKGESGQPREQARIVHAERRVLASTVTATGTIRLRVGSEVRVGSQLSGIVKTLNVTIGSHVNQGDVIAEIDDRPLQARLADADAQAEVDRATMARAEADSRRAQALAAQSLIPAQQADDLWLAFDEAKARYEKSLRDRALVMVDLGYVSIRAPISGTVASVSTQRGETVAASFAAPTFVTIIGEHALQLVAMVDETDIANVRRGDPVTFTVDAYTARDFPGVVESVAPKATIVSGVVNYEVTVTIREGEKLLKPDMPANVSIQTARRSVLVLPAAAVQRDGDQTYVYLAGRTSPERRSVVVGSKDAGMVEIKRGISETDRVLVPGGGKTVS